jgi:hypothetical protein
MDICMHMLPSACIAVAYPLDEDNVCFIFLAGTTSFYYDW